MTYTVSGDVMTESDLLGQVCDSFGGTQRLADAIGIARRSVLRWNAGDDPVPAGIWQKIDAALGERIADYGRLRELVHGAWIVRSAVAPPDY